jgi:hypothetical protein
MSFECFTWGFRLRAKRSIRFPTPAANAIRGALGFTLDPAVFSPGAISGPSGLRNRPRPFVLRASHLDGVIVPEGGEFAFGINAFGSTGPRPAQIVAALADRAELLSATREHVQVPLVPAPGPVTQVTVRYLTPTELKSGGAVVDRPEFPILFARIRERLIALWTFYGTARNELDWPTHAAQIRMKRCDVAWRKARRRSSRTGQTHPLGGLTGEVDYEGDLAPFVPFLRAAFWTGVGRQTVWGNGVIECAVLSPPSPSGSAA